MAYSPPRMTFSPEPHLLTPEDAYYSSPPRARTVSGSSGLSNGITIGGGSSSGNNAGTGAGSNTATNTATTSNTNEGASGSSIQRGRRSRSRRGGSRNRSSAASSARWKKLLWIKQPYPDNYTDASTFLSHWQRNPRFQAYDFWPLVADSTVIVQHVCAVALFVCCFVWIYQDRVSPVSVVGSATAASVAGWIMWDFWLSRDEQEKERGRETLAAAAAREREKRSPNGTATGAPVVGNGRAGAGAGLGGSDTDTLLNGNANAMSPSPSVPSTPGLGISTPASMVGGSVAASKIHSRNQSSTSLTAYGNLSVSTSYPSPPTIPSHPPYQPPSSLLSPRNQQRLATAKSAMLIYLALLGLSPILKSLTMSTTSDSIWAMSCWLLLTNIFTFDYGSSSGPPTSSSSSSMSALAPSSPVTRFPASLSTNAALMASTVLASRLPSTTHVFSLTLFSIEVFGLFPVFRRQLRHRSFALHALLTVLLILGSGAGLGVTLIAGGTGGLTAAAVGAFVWSFGALIAMGGASWWLIGLQRYKNVVIGPWDPARPVIRANAWD